MATTACFFSESECFDRYLLYYGTWQDMLRCVLLRVNRLLQYISSLHYPLSIHTSDLKCLRGSEEEQHEEIICICSFTYAQ